MANKSKFQKSIANLKAPSSTAYSQTDWDAAYANVTPSNEDTRLYQAARRIADECAEAAREYPTPAFGPLNDRWATILAVAALNREYRTAVGMHRDAIKAQGQSNPLLSMDALSGIRLTSIYGQHFTLEDITESSTDLTENWLYDAITATGPAEPPDELSSHAMCAGQVYSFRKAMNVMWNNVQYEGWYYDLSESGSVDWKPGNPDAMILNQTWLLRQRTSLMNYPNIELTIWPKLNASKRRKRARPKAVVAASRHNGKVKVKVGSPTYLSKRPPLYTMEKCALEGVFLKDFLDREMPNARGVTVSKLLLSWHIILDIAQELSKEVQLPTLLSPAHANELALCIGIHPLLKAIEQGVGVSATLASVIVDFLTFSFKSNMNEKGNRGLWSAPLVKLPGSDEYVLPLPALETSNTARKVEAWLEKGGIDDNDPFTQRGELYEALYRSRLSDELKANSKFKNAAWAPNGIKKSNHFGEQIDLLVSFGGICIVGEVKFFLMPTEPSERARYDRKLEGAAAQIKRKTDALQAHPKVVASALGIPEAQVSVLRYVPLIVTAQNYGFSTRVDDVLVVESEFLKMYLGGKDIAVGRAMNFKTGKHIDDVREYYRNEVEAAQKFENEASSPFVLSRFSKRFEWGVSPYPSLLTMQSTIAVPMLQDVSGSERYQAQALLNQLPSSR
jgi:hypothetical protein